MDLDFDDKRTEQYFLLLLRRYLPQLTKAPHKSTEVACGRPALAGSFYLRLQSGDDLLGLLALGGDRLQRRKNGAHGSIAR
ncbi:hypothetical protein [Armatimonas sp.]|uniref:hypothetical protein n=1 Tax=Armatimonas sp. TaxID=1872638 RepID=UPI00286BA11D|nr:hypothetical protein [Armatimonas sp.]